MKKLFAMLLGLSLVGSMAIAPGVGAEDSACVYVTISDENGSLALVQAEVEVTDIDGDGALTINDALYLAHETYFDGGAEAGYASEDGYYGLSLVTLWGVTNGYGYGYYVNNSSAWNLADTVVTGDYIQAFIYTDLTDWSDSYSFFSENTLELAVAENCTLTLSSYGYDSDWNLVETPVVDATITVNGEDVALCTDDEGEFTLSFSEAGVYVISATSTSLTLVPPVCVITVIADEEEEDDAEESDSDEEAELAEDSEDDSDEDSVETDEDTEDSDEADEDAEEEEATETSAETTTVVSIATVTTVVENSTSSSPSTGDSGVTLAVLGGAIALGAMTLVRRKR